MGKKLWVIWKYLNNIICLTLFVGCSSAYAKSDSINCDLTILTDHPVKECALRFEKHILSLSPQQKQIFEEEFKEIEKANIITQYEDYAFLFKKYPAPKVLFNQLQLNIKFNNDTRAISYDSPECCVINQYINIAISYEVVAIMLENKDILDDIETTILQKSKKSSECLHRVLGDLANNPDTSITTQEITMICFQ